ncbi:SMI1/KNR4 family protein [Cypionkella sp.]|uniref:SMI1/KNR4 family protein n=1 Tax=Cypionkella sp. TaxID=2811411 RepID=UPI002AB99C15|nr:SMI1/KNR4 family protein [Cypionkella sp.]MDZ4393309.1 SMI1/KNR4 family protein [Cypionkella sp.]
MTKSVAETIVHLEQIIRQKYDPMGFIDAQHGAYKTGHVPHVAPLAYLCIRYAGLDDVEIDKAESECDRYIPEPYRELLRHMNGARMLGVSLLGGIGGSVDRSAIGIGQPISLRYQNAIGRPDYIPNGHLGIGAINGPWFSQGHLYLTSTGEVELYNARFNMIGARWPSLAVFLEDELSRRFSIYDDEGRILENAKLLPGDTDDWERLAQGAKEEKAKKSLLGHVVNALRRK